MDFTPDDLIRLWREVSQNPSGIWILLIIVVLLSLNLISKLAEAVEGLTRKIIPFFYSKEKKKRDVNLARFADHIEHELRRVNSQEEWRDYRFTDLDAEVETSGESASRGGLLRFIKVRSSGLRRVKSLSEALSISQERLILLEGDPGAGKSVALRHLALDLARKAQLPRRSRTLIPLYINLKFLNRAEVQKIDRRLIEEFVQETLNRVNDRDIEQFLDNEFQRGLREKTWLFLFDSFDEIPEILGAHDVDETIQAYSNAIYDFMHGMNQCRGIVASRYFRGPAHVGWPRFRIVALTEDQQTALVRRAELPPEQERGLLAGLAEAPAEIRLMAGNPLFLSMVVEHIRSGHSFPDDTNSVFKSYLETRLTRDQHRLQRKFNLAPADVRSAAEEIAFCMGRDQQLGLNPTRAGIYRSMEAMGFPVTARTALCLDALEFIKLGRSDVEASGDQRTFTFAHRRFQEFFATQMVLRSPERVAPQELLTQPHWREAAVVILQVYPPEQLAPYFAVISSQLAGFLAQLSTDLANMPQEAIDFPWPAGSLHLLSLLQDGFRNRPSVPPAELRAMVGEIIQAAFTRGTLLHRKWALEVAATAPHEVFLDCVRAAIASPSSLLRDTAYHQIARLDKIPDDIARWVAKSITTKDWIYGIRRNKDTMLTYLARLKGRPELITGFKTLLQLPFITFIASLIGGIPINMTVAGSFQQPTPGWTMLYTAAFAFVQSISWYLGDAATQMLTTIAVIGNFAYFFYLIKEGIIPSAISLLCIYFLLMPLLVKSAFRNGLITGRYSYLITPLVLLYNSTTQFKEKRTRRMVDFKRSGKEMLFPFLPLVAYAGARCITNWLLTKHYILEEKWELAFWLIFAVLIILILLLFLKNEIGAFIKDTLIWSKWLKSGRPFWIEETNILSLLKTEHYLVRIFQHLSSYKNEDLVKIEEDLSKWYISAQKGDTKNKEDRKLSYRYFDIATNLLERIRTGRK